MKYELENHSEALVLGLLTKAMDASKLVSFDCSYVSELTSSKRVFISVTNEDNSFFVITRYDIDEDDKSIYDFNVSAGIYNNVYPRMSVDLNLKFNKDSEVNQNFEKLIEVLNEFASNQKD